MICVCWASARAAEWMEHKKRCCADGDELKGPSEGDKGSGEGGGREMRARSQVPTAQLVDKPPLWQLSLMQGWAKGLAPLRLYICLHPILCATSFRPVLYNLLPPSNLHDNFPPSPFHRWPSVPPPPSLPPTPDPAIATQMEFYTRPSHQLYTAPHSHSMYLDMGSEPPHWSVATSSERSTLDTPPAPTPTSAERYDPLGMLQVSEAETARIAMVAQHPPKQFPYLVRPGVMSDGRWTFNHPDVLAYMENPVEGLPESPVGFHAMLYVLAALHILTWPNHPMWSWFWPKNSWAQVADFIFAFMGACHRPFFRSPHSLILLTSSASEASPSAIVYPYAHACRETLVRSVCRNWKGIHAHADRRAGVEEDTIDARWKAVCRRSSLTVPQKWLSVLLRGVALPTAKKTTRRPPPPARTTTRRPTPAVNKDMQPTRTSARVAERLRTSLEKSVPPTPAEAGPSETGTREANKPLRPSPLAKSPAEADDIPVAGPQEPVQPKSASTRARSQRAKKQSAKAATGAAVPIRTSARLVPRERSASTSSSTAVASGAEPRGRSSSSSSTAIDAPADVKGKGKVKEVVADEDVEMAVEEAPEPVEVAQPAPPKRATRAQTRATRVATVEPVAKPEPEIEEKTTKASKRKRAADPPADAEQEEAAPEPPKKRSRPTKARNVRRR